MLKERVERVRETLERESASWGKPPRLIAVTKYSSPEEILPLAELGVCDIGENRVQALREKLPFLEGKFSIHLIGQLQSNKVKYIIKDVCLIHSMDSLPLAQEIDRQAQKAQRRMPVLVEVNAAGEESKFGVRPEETEALVRGMAGLENIRVKGLMTIAPNVEDPQLNRPYFRQLKQLCIDIGQKNIDNVSMIELSMGMTGDYEVAVEEGATFVRVGTGIFGDRRSLDV